MSEVLALLLDWATKEGRDVRVLTFDFNKFFDRCISGHEDIRVCGDLVMGIVNVMGMGRIKCSRAMLG